MIRTICFCLVGMLMFCGTSQADYLIDNFSMLDDPNTGGGTAAGGFHGGAVTAEVTSSTGIGTTASAGTGVYSFDASNGDMLSILYDWSGIYDALPGHLAGADLAFDLKLGGYSNPLSPNPLGPSIIPVDVLTGSLSDWTMLIDAPGASSETYTATQQIASTTGQYGVQSLAGATSLEFKFTYTGSGMSLIQFGGQDLIAVPEPTALLMFGSVVAIGFSRRRRR